MLLYELLTQSTHHFLLFGMPARKIFTFALYLEERKEKMKTLRLVTETNCVGKNKLFNFFISLI